MNSQTLCLGWLLLSACVRPPRWTLAEHDPLPPTEESFCFSQLPAVPCIKKASIKVLSDFLTSPSYLVRHRVILHRVLPVCIRDTGPNREKAQKKETEEKDSLPCLYPTQPSRPTGPLRQPSGLVPCVQQSLCVLLHGAFL
ncbi:hypothetical protein V8C26DRAFT_70546 [Trichoderma gracile]